MKLERQHIIFYSLGALILLLCAAIAAWQQQLLWLAVPLCFPLLIFALRRPHLLVYALLLTIPWSFEFHFSNSLGTDLPDEPLMWLTALVVVMHIIYREKTLLTTRLHPLLFLLLLQLAWTVITVVCSTNFLLSFKYLLAKSWYLLSFVGAPFLFLDTTKKLKTAALLFAGSMIAVTLIILIRHSTTFFTFSTINDAATPFFRNHVTYSALLVCTVPVIAVCCKHANKKSLRFFSSIILLMVLIAIYFSYARGAWLALLLAFPAYLLLKKRKLATAFAGCILICFLSLFWLQHNNHYLAYAPSYKTTIFHTDFREHLLATYEGKDVSTAERFYRWVAGARMVKDGWLTGYGPNNFYDHYKSYAAPIFRTWVSNNPDHSTVHNYFLLTLIEQGIPGLLFFLALLLCAFYTAQRIYQNSINTFWRFAAAIIAVLLVMICTVNFLSDLIETDKIGSVFYLSLAALMIAEKQGEKLQFAANI